MPSWCMLEHAWILLQILYYGVIRQGTGEDWKDVNISLSSAMPSVAGTVPQLGTQKLRFHVPPPT